MRRHEEVRYAADDLAVNLLRVVVDEPDGVAYQVARLFYLSDVEGSAELAFAVENIDGSPYDADSLSFDKTELADVLGDFYVDADLGNFEGNLRMVLTVNTVKPDDIEKIANHLPYHLRGADAESPSFNWLQNRGG